MQTRGEENLKSKCPEDKNPPPPPPSESVWGGRIEKLLMMERCGLKLEIQRMNFL